MSKYQFKFCQISALNSISEGNYKVVREGIDAYIYGSALLLGHAIAAATHWFSKSIV